MADSATTARRALERALIRLWFDPAPGAAARLAVALLAPLELLTAALARRQRARIEALSAPPVPLVVVGNLVVGGAGKTPLAGALASALAGRGRHPGLLVRGHGRRTGAVTMVSAESSAMMVGDEALVLAHRTGLPVAVGADRGRALALLLERHPEVDVVVSDDGLQHDRLPRSLEIALFDRRGLGNGHLLPAGPLREPAEHLARMDALVLTDDAEAPSVHPLTFRSSIRALGFSRVDGSRRLVPPAGFASLVEPGDTVTALAGIANPSRFFALLASNGIAAQTLELADHEALDEQRLRRFKSGLIVMTEKDAVKCRSFADRRCWFLEIEAIPEPAMIDWLEEVIDG